MTQFMVKIFNSTFKEPPKIGKQIPLSNFIASVGKQSKAKCFTLSILVRQGVCSFFVSLSVTLGSSFCVKVYEFINI